MRWTDEQKAAIDTKNCKLLVAAGAGSGKTAVLVQRIIDKIIIDNDVINHYAKYFPNAVVYKENQEKELMPTDQEIDDLVKDLDL